MLVYNKIDRVEGAEARYEKPNEGRARVWLSAQEGSGLDLLRQALGEALDLRRVVGEIRLPNHAARLRSRLHDLDAVRAESHDEHGWRLSVDLAASDAARLAAAEDGEALRGLLPGEEANPTL